MTPQRRVRLTFRALLTVATVAVGILGRVLAWTPAPIAGLAVAASAIVAVAAGGLALRILVATERF